MRSLCIILCAIIPIAIGQDCVDLATFCHNIVEFKTCNLYESKVNCRKSCNLCNEPVPSPPVEDPNCVDEHEYCRDSFYICRQYPNLEHLCNRTCELCKPSTEPKPSLPEGKPSAAPPEEKPSVETPEEKPSVEPLVEEPVPTTGSERSPECPNVGVQRFDPASRDVVVNKHNELRSKLAHGTVKYAGGNYLKSGKNIYQFSWDCGLEKIAQDWANRCQYGHSTKEHSGDAGENIYKWSKSDAYDSIDTNMLRAIGMWWDDEIEKYDASYNTENIMDNTVLSIAGHWSQQAWGATTKIGCGIANCTEDSWFETFVVCNYLIAGNYFGKPIFEWGNGCSADSDCTTYPNSKCNTSNKLCIAPKD